MRSAKPGNHLKHLMHINGFGGENLRSRETMLTSFPMGKDELICDIAHEEKLLHVQIYENKSLGLPSSLLTSHVNDFVNAKGHAREKLLLAG